MFQTNITLGVQSAETDRNELPLPFLVIFSDFFLKVLCLRYTLQQFALLESKLEAKKSVTWHVHTTYVYRYLRNLNVSIYWYIIIFSIFSPTNLPFNYLIFNWTGDSFTHKLHANSCEPVGAKELSCPAQWQLVAIVGLSQVGKFNRKSCNAGHFSVHGEVSHKVRIKTKGIVKGIAVI